MAIRSLIAATSGGPASAGAVALACQVAHRFGSHIECYHARLDPQAFILAASYGDYGMIMDGAWMDELEAQSAASAAKAKQAALEIFRQRAVDLADRPPYSGPSAAWFEETGFAPRLVARRARFFDLAILGRSQRVVGEAHTDVIEETLLRSGRPVLLAPAQESGEISARVAIAWNGTPPAIHALAASLPFLALARTILVLNVGDRANESLDELKKYLGWHGISAEVRQGGRSGLDVGDTLLALCRDEGASMLVMGGFGHTPWRELLLGGATREVIGSMSLPVLLSH